jgi:glutaminyl-tRNA synthetase
MIRLPPRSTLDESAAASVVYPSQPRLIAASTAAKTGIDFSSLVNPHSLEVLTGAKVEPQLGGAPSGSRFQFERQGYFSVDPDSRPGTPVFNRTVSLKDSWTKGSQQSIVGS